jgi:hypothetical protein
MAFWSASLLDDEVGEVEREVEGAVVKPLMSACDERREQVGGGAKE